jgi:hypothetical protein
MAKAALKVVPTYETIGDIAERMEELRKQRKVLAAQDKPLKDEYDELAIKALDMLDATKQTKGGSKHATLTVSEVAVPKITDIAKLVAHISRNKLWHLFLAQPLTTPAWREARELKGTDLPGTEAFTKRGINHTSVA